MPTMNEVKAAVDNWLGIVSEMLPWEGDPEHHVELFYKSPSGILLFKLGFHLHDGVWRFAQRTFGIPLDLDHLRTLTEPLKQAEPVPAAFQES